MAFEVIFAGWLFNLLIHSRIIKECYEISVTESMRYVWWIENHGSRKKASSSDEDCHLQGREGTEAASQNALVTDAVEWLQRTGKSRFS